MKPAGVAAIAALTLMPSTGTTGAAEPGDLLWEDRLDTSPFEQAFSVAALNHQVFVAGFVGVFGNRDFVIRAYDDRTGALTWEDRRDSGFDEFASGVTTDHKRVFVTGAVFVPGRGNDWIVRAYAPEDGTLLWEHVFDFAGRSDLPRGTAVAAGNGLLFVGGSGTNARGNLDWIIRAYDAGTGTLAWQDRVDTSGGGDLVRSLVVKAGAVFAAGVGFSFTTSDVIVRAYDARTGGLRWEHRTSGPQSPATFPWRIVADEGRVFVGATIDTGELDTSHRYHVEALDAVTGALIWQDRLDKGEADDLYDIDAHDGKVFAVGVGGAQCLLAPSPPSSCDSLVRAYDGATGAVAWEHERDATGTSLDDFASNVTARNGMVFVLSQQPPLEDLPGCCLAGAWLLQAFDAATGQFLWQSAGGPLESASYNMVVHRGRLVIPGRSVDPATRDWDFIVRAYDTRGAGIE